MFSNSSINWCESDYTKSRFIAEYWNTLTGVCLCISSLVSYQSNIKYNMNILYYSNFLLFIVGIGTILFHSTLIYIWQLLDEIPMMLIVIEYYRILTQNITLKKHTFFYNIRPFNVTKIYYLLPFIITSYYIHPKLQIILFQGILSLCIINLLYTCYLINTFLSKSKDSMSRNLRPIIVTYAIDLTNDLKYNLTFYHYKGLFILITSLIIWNIDNNYCQHYIELHAVWHVMTSIGMYYCNEIMKSYLLLFKINLINSNNISDW
jgi:dihydroceramidase